MKKVETIKRGRFTVGAIYALDDGRLCFVSYQKLSDLFRDGEKSISDAIREGKAAWSIDFEILMKARAKGAAFVVVQARETNDRWLTTMDRFMNGANHTRGYAIYKRLDLRQFRYRPATPKLK